jgi:hypothetical protein
LRFRQIRVGDRDLLLRAQEAARYDTIQIAPEDIEQGLANRAIEGIVMETPHSRMVLCWQRDGKSAVVGALYREGSQEGLLTQTRMLWERASARLREFGVESVGLTLSSNNPRFPTLLKMYERGGFAVTGVTMQAILTEPTAEED